MPPARPLIDRAIERIDASGDCWTWTGKVEKTGYGRLTTRTPDGYRTYLAHRLVWEVLVGPIPDGLTLDHLCRNQLCVNPDHLEPVTMGENMKRGASPTAKALRRETCLHGHPYTAKNTYFRVDGGRRCRTCVRDAQRRQRL